MTIATKPMIESTHLARVKGNRLREVIILALFNEMRVNAFSLAVGNEDTTFEYLILTQQRLSKPRLAETVAFVRGIECAYRSF